MRLKSFAAAQPGLTGRKLRISFDVHGGDCQRWEPTWQGVGPGCLCSEAANRVVRKDGATALCAARKADEHDDQIIGTNANKWSASVGQCMCGWI